MPWNARHTIRAIMSLADAHPREKPKRIHDRTSMLRRP